MKIYPQNGWLLLKGALSDHDLQTLEYTSMLPPLERVDHFTVVGAPEDNEGYHVGNKVLVLTHAIEEREIEGDLYYFAKVQSIMGVLFDD